VVYDAYSAFQRAFVSTSILEAVVIFSTDSALVKGESQTLVTGACLTLLSI
jgi:hypothetical protein